MEIAVGLRVVRGPDWKWANQDDGVGHCGTVVEIGKPGSQTTPDKTVVVQWDSGSRTNYRIGYQNAYDLRVFDNAPIGVLHPNVICNSCKKHGIYGMRWKCLSCQNIDLCTICYMSDKHDTNHPFARFETHSSIGVEMPKRNSKNNTKVQTRGIYTGARVTRGYDWDWGNQDGGEAKVGKVLDIRGWDNESKRSVANVMWASGSTNVYRVGHKGKVDLKYVVDAPGCFYYPEHLPVLGLQIESTNRLLVAGAAENATQIASASSKATANANALFSVGDKVKVIVEDVNELKSLQEGHGGWNQRMSEFIGQVGRVHRVTDRGDIRVQFEGCHNRWTFNPVTLSKVTSYAIGDVVKICDDINKVKELQKSHGEWIDHMRGALGKVGQIIKVYADGDLRVTVDGRTWTFNPQCVSQVPENATEINNTMISHQSREDCNPRLGNLLAEQQQQQQGYAVSQQTQQEPFKEKVSTSSLHATKENLVREAAQGRIDSVKGILQQHPENVDFLSSGKTALQVAAHQGHLEIVSILLDSSADINLKDEEGDTALHYAAFGNQPDVIELLLKKGADIDATNRTKCSALHIAVNKGYQNCAKVLVKHNCNVNLQDSYGDTALHDAIGRTENLEIIDALISSPLVNFGLRNKRGFNILHHAALKGNNFAAEKIITKSRQLVDCKKEDGFAALHLAALNGHYQMIETLIVQGQADINIINNRKQTPLHLAVSQMHFAIIEMLVSYGANVNQVNEDNDSALHVAIAKCADEKALKNEKMTISQGVNEHLNQLATIGYGQYVNLAIACYLIQEGNADVTLRNRKGKTPLDLVELLTRLETDTGSTSSSHKQLRDLLTGVVESRSLRRPQAVGAVTHCVISELAAVKPVGQHSADSAPEDTPVGGEPSECIICNDAPNSVLFEPCGHQLSCEECCERMKKCLKCGQAILAKIVSGERKSVDKKTPDLLGNNKRSVERLMYLESKIAEIEEANCCTICMENVRNVVFLCGHGACAHCAQTLKTCHMCRKTITKKINLYN